MATGNSPGRTILYPDWQPQYEAALLEPDAMTLPQRIKAAEELILERLRIISALPTEWQEREALENALGALRVMTREMRG